MDREELKKFAAVFEYIIAKGRADNAPLRGQACKEVSNSQVF